MGEVNKNLYCCLSSLVRFIILVDNPEIDKIKERGTS